MSVGRPEARSRPGVTLRLLGGLLVLYLLGPLVAFAVRFAAPGPHGFGEPGLWAAFGTSVLSASVSTAVIAVLGIPLARWLSRSTTWTSRTVGLLVQLPLALPPVMSGIVLVYVVGPYTPVGELFGDGLTDSFWGVVLAQVFVAAPFLVIGARSAFRGVDPALEEVAAALGHRPPARFFRVVLPAASDGVRAAMVLAWLRALGEYGATALLAYHPYTLPVFVNVQFQGAGLPTTQAPTALALGVAVLAVAVGALRSRRRRRAVVLPEPREPRSRTATPVAFDLSLRRGRFVLEAAHDASSHLLALLGPSGAGKTLTLHALAGVLHATGADATSRVRIGDRPVGAVAPEDRGVGYVPQGGVLLPRRTVWEQVTFGVGVDPAVARWWLVALRVDELADRWPDELSGGQRQRVALAQALAREPDVVLLDEPFSALDGPVRDALRAELRRLQRTRGLSTVVVTHDPEEAALLADEVVVLDHGRVLQQGDRAAVYHRPATPAVARLVGMRNVVEGRAESAGVVRAGGVRIPAGAATASDGRAVFWSVRPEAVRVTAPTVGEDDGHVLAATVLDAVDLGGVVQLEVALDGGPILLARASGGGPLPSVGEPCGVTIPADAVSVWDVAPGRTEAPTVR